MLQTFEAQSSPEQGPSRLAALRLTMAQHGFDGFLVPRADAHHREYVAERDARLERLTGFSGFAGEGKARDVMDHLGTDVVLRDVDDFLNAVKALGGPVQIDPKSCPDIIATTLRDAEVEVIEARDPCVLPKARKNEVEIAGAKAAQERDGVAMVQFLARLDAQDLDAGLTEIDVVKTLEGFRLKTNALRYISFDTISGAGTNGAIVHCRVNENTNRRVGKDELLLVDSGGQYVDGTTDITRTIAMGTPTDEQRACYTRVLQGMIAISRARFPKDVGGQNLDALARAPLWMAGMDYDQGTGHGVGSYLCVHEGPQRLARRSKVAFEPGMILSNEPGYYREGAFGIRIENLIIVVEAPAIPGGDDRDMLCFETLTYVPFDRRLIDTAILSRPERDWIDQYHATTLDKLASRLDPQTQDWLRAACAPL
ncbi:aminopeptidase family protein P [Cognatiyoonia sp. IB215446]|uniref:aminopeptidase family protein P n=1 Tax=Cognatiyoonia sp. IB215446 TaxID=3097355 RepID=UPI002A16ADD3|nr:aminopeptidase family protein P [Cognatiyoonia sp. IB215446]MDX8348372.1 aminopeptidase family protein P [Cognatiyoonia sp. IB215446]